MFVSFITTRNTDMVISIVTVYESIRAVRVTLYRPYLLMHISEVITLQRKLAEKGLISCPMCSVH